MKVNEQIIAEAQRMHDAGESYCAIGRALDVSDTTVRYWLDPAARVKANAEAAAYRGTHHAETKAYNAAYYSTHSEGIKAQAAAWGATHRKEKNAATETWRRKHPSDHNARESKRRALKAGMLIGITVSQLAEIAEIYRKAHDDERVRCYLCGALIPKGHRHVDHIVPLSKGGAHRPSNLAVACEHCNESKGAKLPNEVGVLI